MSAVLPLPYELTDAYGLALVDAAIAAIGRHLESRIAERGRSFFYREARLIGTESNEARAARLRGRRLMLGAAAWRLSLDGAAMADPDYFVRLQMEYDRIAGAEYDVEGWPDYYDVSSPRMVYSNRRTIVQEIGRREYERHRYRRREAETLGLREREWNEGLRDWLVQVRLSEIATAMAPPAPDPLDVERDDSADQWLEMLPPAERAALQRCINGDAPADAAERKALSRAKEKIRREMSQNDRISTLLDRGEEESPMTTAVLDQLEAQSDTLARIALTQRMHGEQLDGIRRLLDEQFPSLRDEFESMLRDEYTEDAT